MKRRFGFLAALLAVMMVAVGIASQPVRSQGATTLQTAGLKLEQVGAGIYALIAEKVDFPPTNPKLAIANGGFIIGSDSVLMVDAFQSPDLAELALATVKTVTDKPVRYVLNTHYHFDHTGGNPAFKKLGIPIVGRGLARDYVAGRRGPNAQSGTNVPPDLLINSRTDLWLGDRAVRIEPVEGHAAGTDLVAYVPDAKILFAADMVFNMRVPFAGEGDADLRQWQGSLYRLAVTFPEAKVVPGHGEVTDLAGIQTQQAFFDDLERLARRWKAQNLKKEEAIAQSSKIIETYRTYKFQALYTTALSTAYDQFTRSATIPLIP
ncbi:MAG: MBL fold metallo-hydrolase [Oscillatoriales cyanobacterium SM2_2_1]|nr:MBL fold metallo-hydrolase [Oscillatoriales cyanobacterium SM2_2_1]